ncbi:MAG: hypothetical protein LBT40_15280 [Deltaproteobacteria bacterium]|nr:hypothetical protein [Deltaproteobacteria bacterium]
MPQTPAPPGCSSEELDTLEFWASDSSPDRDIALRAKIVTMALAGEESVGIALKLLTSPAAVKLWTDAFAAEGTEGLLKALPDGRAAAAREMAAKSLGPRGKTPAPGCVPPAAAKFHEALMEAGLFPRGSFPSVSPEVSHSAGNAPVGQAVSPPAAEDGPYAGPAPADRTRSDAGTAPGPDSRVTENAAGSAGGTRPRRTGPAPVSPAVMDAVTRLVSGPPPDGARQWSTVAAARELGISQTTASNAFRAAGIPRRSFRGLTEGAAGTAGGTRRRRTGPSPVSPGVMEAVTRLVSGPPPDGARQWSGAAVARELGISPSTASNAFRAAGIPHERFWGVTGAALSSRSQEDLDELERMAEGHAPTPDIARRAGLVAAVLRGETVREAGIRFGVNPRTSSNWVRAFSRRGPAWFRLPSRVGNPSPMTARGLVRELVAGPPPDGRDRWTERLAASELGISFSIVRKALKAEGIRLASPNSVDIILAARSEEELAELERMAEGHAPTPVIAARAGAVAALLDGETLTAAAQRFGMTNVQAARWGRSFARLGLDGLSRMTPEEGPAVLKARPLARALALSPPPEGRSRWSAALIARELRLNHNTVIKALDAEGIRLVPESFADRILAARSDGDLAELERMAEGHAQTPLIADRARAVLAVIGGETTSSVANRFGVRSLTVSRWASSFARLGPQCLVQITAHQKPDGAAVLESRQLVRELVRGHPPDGHDRWTVPLIASKIGRNVLTVQHALAEEGIRLPHHNLATRILARRSSDDLANLLRLAEGRASSPEVAARAGALVAFLNGDTMKAAGERFGISRTTAMDWANSFASHGPAGLESKTPALQSERQQVKELAIAPPPEGHDRWSRLLIAEELGLSVEKVDHALKTEGILLGQKETGTALLGSRSREDLAVLERMAKGDASSPKAAARAAAVLSVLRGDSMAGAGKVLGVTGPAMRRWVELFTKRGPAVLEPKTRYVRRSFPKACRRVRDLASGPPPDGRDRWTFALIAGKLGMSIKTVRKALDAEGILLERDDFRARIQTGRSPEELSSLKRMADGGSLSPEIAARAGAVLAVLGGRTMKGTGQIFGVAGQTVKRWVQLFDQLGPAGLLSKKQHVTRSFPEACRQVRDLASGPPPDGRARWSLTQIAGKLGMSAKTVRKALAAEGIRLGP